MTNYKDYLEKKANSNAEIISAGGGYAIAIKRFNPETGALMPPEITAIDLETLQKEKIELQSSISDIDAIILEISEL